MQAVPKVRPDGGSALPAWKTVTLDAHTGRSRMAVISPEGDILLEFGHPERAMPFCVKRRRIEASSGRVFHEEAANHRTRDTVRLSERVETDRLVVKLMESWGDVPTALFGVRCYAE